MRLLPAEPQQWACSRVHTVITVFDSMFQDVPRDAMWRLYLRPFDLSTQQFSSPSQSLPQEDLTPSLRDEFVTLATCK